MDISVFTSRFALLVSSVSCVDLSEHGHVQPAAPALTVAMVTAVY